ncbi:HAD family hydrolase [Brevibacillus sp. SYSU BS000544]|uniref:HAD family hydrolase n=1 Tax=Brevibacillus sp. SYSU BS000544 TaxID=3416443 RepID=UPI003CE50EA8
MEPKAIILDLDGTILDSAKKISRKTIEILQAIRNKGIHLIFATARPPRSTLFEEINLSSLGTIIYYNGAMFDCKISNQTIHFSIPSKKSKEIIEFCLFLNADANISIEVQNKWFSSKSLDYREMMKVKDKPSIISFDELVSHDCTKILLTDFSFSKELVSKYGKELNILVTDSGQLIQIMSPVASKECAVEYILNTLQVKLSDAMCFGDDFNDLGLFQSCGYSVAMGNAIEELKNIANEITLENDKDGVAMVLERFVNKNTVPTSATPSLLWQNQSESS